LKAGPNAKPDQGDRIFDILADKSPPARDTAGGTGCHFGHNAVFPRLRVGGILAAMTRLRPSRWRGLQRAGHIALAAAGWIIAGNAVAAQNPAPRTPGSPSAVDTTTTTVPFFPLGTSPLELRGDARPGIYLAAVGRRAIAMGTEDGRLELWSWPIKWMHDLQLSFRIPKYTEPISGRTVAHSVIERPEGVTVEYAYEQFTVREHIFVPLDLPAVIVLLEVDAIRPLDIIATFAPDIHFAWPASLGGQYLVWEQDARAFLFSEGKRSINAYFGSPAVTQASDVPAHMLAAAPPQLVLGVGSGTDRYTAPRLGEPPGHNVNLRTAYIPIVLAGGAMPRDSALAMYRALIAPGAAEREWKRRVAHADSLRRTTFSLHSPDSLLDRAVEYAKVNLDESFVCNPDLGCGLVAGYGLSGNSSGRTARSRTRSRRARSVWTGSATRTRSTTATRRRSGCSHSVSTGGRPATRRSSGSCGRI